MSQMANKLAAKGVAAMAAALEAGASKDEAAAAGAAAMLAAAKVFSFPRKGQLQRLWKRSQPRSLLKSLVLLSGSSLIKPAVLERALMRLAASMGMALAAQPVMISTSTTKLWLMSCWR